MSIVINFFLVIEVLVSLLIVLLVLMQRPKSEGLGAAFGGGMTENLFGAQTTNVLQKTTRWLGGMFFAVALILSMLYSRSARSDNQSVIQQQLTTAPLPKAPVDIQSKENQVALPASGTLTPDAIRSLIQQKVKDAQAAASGSSTGSSAPAASPDAATPALQLQTNPGTQSSGLQLQTGTAAGDQKKDGL